MLKSRLLTPMVLGSSVLASFANGFRLPNQDPEAIARGNAFSATADNPSAIYYNPAGITQLEGQQVRAGIYAISTGVDYTSPAGAKESPDSAFQPVPQLYYVNSPKDLPLSFGLGVYTPFGLAIDWGKNNPFSTVAQEGTLLYLTANPVVAWQITETLSLGIGPNISYSEAEFVQSVVAPGVDRFRFKGDDWGYSFNAGLRWQPHEQWAFGLNYRYLTTMEYEGRASTSPTAPGLPLAPYFPSVKASGSIRFPQSLAGGVSYRPTDKWNLEVNVDWTDWDNLNSLALKGTPIPIALNLNYESSWMYNFGVTRKLPHDFFLSGGYIFSENSSPDAGFSPLIPDTNLHLFSIGTGQRLKRWDWAISYTFAYNSGRDVKGSPVSVVGQSADGEYEIHNHAINIAATFKF